MSAKDPRPGSDRLCYHCRECRAVPGQNGYCGGPCRFWSRVVKGDGCWVWQGGRHTDAGYGRVTVSGRRVMAHVFAYEQLVGPVPVGFELDHVVCQNTRCVNPAHVEPVTHTEHGRRSGIISGQVRRRRSHA